MDAEALQRRYPDIDREVLSRVDERLGNTTRGALYRQSRESGNDDRFAAIVALRRVAIHGTDSTFLASRPHFSEIYGPDYARRTLAKLKAKGVNVTSRTDYDPGLADEEADPNAVLDGRSVVKRRAERIKRAAEVARKTKPPRLSERLIIESAAEFERTSPDEIRKMDHEEVRQHMIEKHGAKARSN